MKEPMQARFTLTMRDVGEGTMQSFVGACAGLTLYGPGAPNFGAAWGTTDLTPRLVFGSTSGSCSNGAAIVTQALAVEALARQSPRPVSEHSDRHCTERRRRCSASAECQQLERRRYRRQ